MAEIIAQPFPEEPPKEKPSNVTMAADGTPIYGELRPVDPLAPKNTPNIGGAALGQTTQETGQRSQRTGASSTPLAQTAEANSFGSDQRTSISANGTPIYGELQPVDLVPHSRQASDQAAGKAHASLEDLNDPTMGARVFLDGLTFGFADEVGAAILAAVATATQGSYGGTQSFGNIYDEMMGQLEMERTAWEDENPGKAVLLELSGGIVSPANKVLFKGLQQVGGLANALGRQLGRFGVGNGTGATSVQRALQRLEQTGRPQSILERSIKAPAQSSLQRSIQATKEALPSAAVGGAIYGAGKSPNRPSEDLSERLGGIGEDALEGALWGTAFSPLAGVGRNIADRITRRRVTQDLGKGDDAIPFHLAVGEGDTAVAKGLQYIYKNVVGQAWFGHNAIQQQQSRWKTVLMNQATMSKQAFQTVKKRSAALLSQIKQKAEQAAKDLQAELRKKNPELRGKGDEQRASLKVKQQKEKALANKRLADELAAQERFVNNRFRNLVVKQAIPEGAPKKAVAEIEALLEAGDFLALNKALNEVWRTHGFPMLNRSFSMGAGTQSKLIDDVIGAIEAESNILAMDKSRNAEQALSILESFFETAVNGGRITGESLSQLRSRISELRNQAFRLGSASAAEEVKVLQVIQRKLDDIVLGQLSNPQQERFARHKEQWRTKLGLNSTITNTGGIQQRGAFTPEDWVKATKSEWVSEFAEGRAPFQREAMEHFDLLKSNKEATEALFNTAFDDMAVKHLNELQLSRSQVLREIDMVEEAIQKAPERIEESINAGKARSALKGDPVYSERQLEDLKAKKEAVEFQIKMAQELFSVPGASVFTKSFMASILGGFQSLGGGLLVAGGLARPGTQRFLAGQTAIQEYTNRLLQQGRQSRMAYMPEVVAAGNVAGDNLGISRSNAEAMLKASPPVQARLYEQLSRSGRIESFAIYFPEVADKLQESYEAQQREPSVAPQSP